MVYFVKNIYLRFFPSKTSSSSFGNLEPVYKYTSASKASNLPSFSFLNEEQGAVAAAAAVVAAVAAAVGAVDALLPAAAVAEPVVAEMTVAVAKTVVARNSQAAAAFAS